jgi:hypothetical protein
MELYVYYRVKAGHESALLQAASALHQALCAEIPGLTARLLRRTDPIPLIPQSATVTTTPAAPGLQMPPDLTWMEVYYRTSAPLDPEQLRHIDASAQAALSPWTVGERHREFFLDRMSTPLA